MRNIFLSKSKYSSMLFILMLGLLFFPGSIVSASTAVRSKPPEIVLDSQWKKKIFEYAQANLKHSAWGLAHSERDYWLSINLAKQENVKIDKDVIFAAAFLHDIGAISPFMKKEIEHSIRSVELAKSLLTAYDFPMQKWPKVKAAIFGHMYYAHPSANNEAIVFHDADTLDFLGTIGIARLISVTERDDWAPNLQGSLNTLHQFKIDLPKKLITPSAKKMAVQRVQEMNAFFLSLDQENFMRKAL